MNMSTSEVVMSDTEGLSSLPETVKLNICYEKYGMVFSVRRENASDTSRYIVNVCTLNGEHIGYFYFRIARPNDKDPWLKFFGMKVVEKFRNFGLGNLFMNELFDISDRIGIPLKTTARQIKPVSCAMLSSYGFSPMTPIDDSSLNAVRVSRGEAGKVVLGFNSASGASHFAKSKHFMSNGNFEIVEGVDSVREGALVVLGRSYHLNDVDMAAKKRAAVNERLREFIISDLL